MRRRLRLLEAVGRVRRRTVSVAPPPPHAGVVGGTDGRLILR